MVTYRHWFVSLWRDPDDVSHCRILSPDKTEWRLILATLCGWRRCFVADQLWFMTLIREEEEVLECIQYKIAVLSYKVVHDTTPRYLGPLTRVADIPGRRTLRSASTNRLNVPHLNFPPSAAELFRLPPHRSGTHCQKQSYQHCGCSSTNWKLCYLNYPSFISTVLMVSQ